MEVSVQEMTNEILNCIKQYTEEASEKIAEVCKEESEILKENLKRGKESETKNIPVAGKSRKPLAVAMYSTRFIIHRDI